MSWVNPRRSLVLIKPSKAVMTSAKDGGVGYGRMTHLRGKGAVKMQPVKERTATLVNEHKKGQLRTPAGVRMNHRYRNGGEPSRKLATADWTFGDIKVGKRAELEPGELAHQIELAKSFLKGGRALRAIEMTGGQRATALAGLQQSRATRLKGKTKPPGNAQKRPAQAAVRFRNRSHDKRHAAWEAAGSPRLVPTGAQTHTEKNRNALLSPTVALSGFGGVGVGAGAAAVVHHRRKERLAKADRNKTDMAIGAAGGLAAAEGVHTLGGQAGKTAASATRRKHWDKKTHQPIWDAHLKAHGISEKVTGNTPQGVKQKLYSTYPKSLPGWKAQRLVAYKNKPAIYGGMLAAGALGGAALAGRKQKVTKAYGRTAAMDAARWSVGLTAGSAAGGGAVLVAERKNKDRAKHAGAAVAGGLAGQAAYQGTVYGVKRSALRADRRSTVSNSQRRKHLDAVKHQHGWHTKEMYRNYPKALPAASRQRLVAHLGRGKRGVLIGTAATLAGGAGGLALARKKEKK